MARPLPGTARDPFAVIEEEPPRLTEGAAEALVLQQFGLRARARPLLSERDQNFRLQADDGRQFVLKVANAAEPAAYTTFQIDALRYVERARETIGSPVNTPLVVPTLAGSSHAVIDLSGARHVVRVVTYLPGTPLAQVRPSRELSGNLGAYLAWLGRMLRDFDDHEPEQALLWDMKKALELRRLLRFIADRALRRAVAGCLDEFEAEALPAFAGLRTQVIHNDFNPDNVLVDRADPTQPVGVIDFGDMQTSPLVVDVAVGASYLRVLDGDPLRCILAFVKGYAGVTRLDDTEAALLFPLILARLCASITILRWRAALRGGDDPYLLNAAVNETSAEEFLGALLALPRDRSRQAILQACGSG